MHLWATSITTITCQPDHQEGGLGTCVADELHTTLENGNETRDLS